MELIVSWFILLYWTGIMCSVLLLVFGGCAWFFWFYDKKELSRKARLACWWSTLSFVLPFKTKKWWIGVLLMLVSPAALFSYALICLLLLYVMNAPVSYEKLTYKEQGDLVALTGLPDFPKISYDHNVHTMVPMLMRLPLISYQNPSKNFISQIKKSKKWEKVDSITYKCHSNTIYGLDLYVTVKSNSRVVLVSNFTPNALL